jgi:hypothetical protein
MQTILYDLGSHFFASHKVEDMTRTRSNEIMTSLVLDAWASPVYDHPLEDPNIQSMIFALQHYTNDSSSIDCVTLLGCYKFSLHSYTFVLYL